MREETLIIKIDPELREELHRKCEEMGKSVDEVVSSLIKLFVRELPGELDLVEFVRQVKLTGGEKLGCDLTLDEYMALAEEEREKLWDEEFAGLMERIDAAEVDPRANAIPAGQGSAEEMRRRVRELRKECEADA